MKALKFFADSQGKGNRNDDFFAHYKILSTRALVLVGDFTSDSPKGANTKLKQSLNAFVEKRLTTWREHLIPPQDILGLLARFINRELGQGRATAKTTLCACVVDCHEHQIHFLNVGDSGFGIGHDGQFQFLRKGDVGGARDATGFLPLETESFTVFEAPFPKDARLLLFTDGFWENTAHFLDPAHTEPQLAKILAEPSLDKIASRFCEQILAHSNQRDDFTFIIVKEETVAQKHGDQNQPTPKQWEAFIEKKVFEIIDRHDGLRPIPPSPMETEFLQVLKQTATGLQAMERRLLENLRRENEAVHQDLAGQWQTRLGQMSDQLNQLKEALKEQRLTFKARVGNAVNDATRDLRQLRDLASLPDQLADVDRRLKIVESNFLNANVDQLKRVNLDQVQRRLAKLEKPSSPSSVAAKPIERQGVAQISVHEANESEAHRFGWRSPWLWLTVNSACLVLILGWLLFVGLGERGSNTQKQAPGIAAVEKDHHQTPAQGMSAFERLALRSTAAAANPVPDWPQDLRQLQPPDDLLRLMGFSRNRARRELLCLARGMAKSKVLIQAGERPDKVTPTVSIPLENCAIGGQSQFLLKIRSSNSPTAGTHLIPWLKQYASSTSKYPSGMNLGHLWLQIHAQVNTIDGDFGSTSQAAFQAKIGKRLQLTGAGDLEKALTQWTTSKHGGAIPEDLIVKAANFLHIGDPLLLKTEIQRFKTELFKEKLHRNGDGIFMRAVGKRNTQFILAVAGELTPLGEWVLAYEANPKVSAAPIVASLLANRLAFPTASGELRPIIQALKDLQAKPIDALLRQVSQSDWGKP